VTSAPGRVSRVGRRGTTHEHVAAASSARSAGQYDVVDDDESDRAPVLALAEALVIADCRARTAAGKSSAVPMQASPPPPGRPRDRGTLIRTNPIVRRGDHRDRPGRSRCRRSARPVRGHLASKGIVRRGPFRAIWVALTSSPRPVRQSAGLALRDPRPHPSVARAATASNRKRLRNGWERCSGTPDILVEQTARRRAQASCHR